MAVCAYCGAETDLYLSGVPVCVECDDWREGKGPRPERKPPKSTEGAPPEDDEASA